MNVRGHLGGDFASKGHVPCLKDGMHPANTDTVSTFEMTHRWILACTNHSNHGLVVVIEDEVGVLPPICCHSVMAGNPKRVIAKSAATISASGVE